MIDKNLENSNEVKETVSKKKMSVGNILTLVVIFILCLIVFGCVYSSISENLRNAEINNNEEFYITDVSFDNISELTESNTKYVILNSEYITPDILASACRAVNVKCGKKSIDELSNNDLFKANIKVKNEYYTIFEVNKKDSDFVLSVNPTTWGKVKQSDIEKAVRIFFNVVVDRCEDCDIAERLMYDIQEIDSNTSKVMLPILFDNSSSDMYAKPVIYLYPTEKIDIDITIDGVDFTTTYPKYENKWSVTAYPDGTLVDKNNREYNYLYWEGNAETNFDLSEGFVVHKNEYVEFLESKLEYIGLTDKEACDFISFWLPQMNEYEYVQVHFCENYTDIVKKNYSILPNNELNLCIVFKGLEKPIEVKEQDISWYKDFKREGFVAVEWGGIFLR